MEEAHSQPMIRSLAARIVTGMQLSLQVLGLLRSLVAVTVIGMQLRFKCW